VLFCLLVAPRPLSLSEAQSLEGADPGNDAFTGTTAADSYDIVPLSGSLLVLDAGAGRFRHNVLRQYLTDLASQGRIL